jgi:hypothetical protein
MMKSRDVLAELGGVNFQPEVVVPAQLWPRRRETPEEALASAVLEDAVECLRKYRAEGNGYGTRRYRETEAWFLFEKQDWPFSFERICEYLRLDPNCVRRAVGVPSGRSCASPPGPRASRPLSIAKPGLRNTH